MAAASSGLMVTPTHSPRVLLRRRIAALLSIDRFARRVCVLVHSFLHLMRALCRLQQGLDNALRLGRPVVRRATDNEQNRQRHCHILRHTHVHLGTAGPIIRGVYNRSGRTVTRSSRMFRFALLMLLTTGAYAAQSVDIESAARIYQEAAMREQVRATLGAMPAHIRQLFSADAAAQLSEQQLSAVTAAAKRGFRIDVFEVPALSALAANLDAATEKKIESFLESDLGRRMVAADVATAALEEPKIDKIMKGELSAPSTPQRDALFDKLEQASRSTESTVQIFLSMGKAVAIGTAVGSGRDIAAVAESARKSGEASRP